MSPVLPPHFLPDILLIRESFGDDLLAVGRETECVVDENP